MDQSTNKIVNGFSYISILFAPILFPLIVWVLSGTNTDMKGHAQRALWLHILPVILTIVAFILVGSTGLLTNNAEHTGWVTVILFGIVALVDFGLFIYNLIVGLKIWLAK